MSTFQPIHSTSTGVALPKYDTKVLNQIQSKEVLNGILRGYMAKPEEIYLYPVDPLDIYGDAYQDMFTVMNLISKRGIKAVDKGRISDILKEKNLDLHAATSPSALKSLETTLHSLCDLVNLDKNAAIENLPAYYNQQNKYFTLRELYKRGANISDFFIPSTETGILNDAEYREQARKNLENNTAEEIRDIVLGVYQDSPTMTTKVSIPLVRDDGLPHANDEVTWLVDKVIRHGSFNSIIGAAKAGKSQCAMQLSFCIKNGLDFLGKFKVDQSEVIYVDFELEDFEIKRRYNMLREFYNMPDAPSPYIFALKNQFTSGHIDMDYIINTIKKYKKIHKDIKFVVFDCFYTFSKGDSNSEEDVWKTLQPLKALSGADNDLTVLYVHHTNKNGVNMDNAVYAAGGSGVHGKVIDTSIVIGSMTAGKRNNVVDDMFVLKAVGRSGGFKAMVCDRSESNQFFFQPIDDEDIRVTNAIKKTEFVSRFPKTWEAFQDAQKKGKNSIPLRDKKDGSNIYRDIIVPEFAKDPEFKVPESILILDTHNYKVYMPKFCSEISESEAKAEETANTMAETISENKGGIV